jgi:hypothetical protein
MIETLDTTGFLITELAAQWAMLAADFGDGYGAAKLDGLQEGLRRWAITIDALPDTFAQGQIDDLLSRSHWLAEGGGGNYVLTETGARILLGQSSTRGQYLWRFFRTSKAAGDKPFWLELEDPETGTRKKYLANFVDHKLSYQVLCAQLYATGLQLAERRLPAVSSPAAHLAKGR